MPAQQRQTVSVTSPSMFVCKYHRPGAYREALLSATRALPGFKNYPSAQTETYKWMYDLVIELLQKRLLPKIIENIELSRERVSKMSDDLKSLVRHCQGPLRVWHLTDLHIGKRPYRNTGQQPFHETITRHIEDLTDAKKPDIVVISGDLTHTADLDLKVLNSKGTARASEFRVAENFLSCLASKLRSAGSISNERRLVIVPGNHDVNWLLYKKNKSFDLFQRYVDAARFITPFSGLSEGNVAFSSVIATCNQEKGAPIAAVKYSLRNVDMVLLLLVTNYCEGQLPNKQEMKKKGFYYNDRKAVADIKLARSDVQKGKKLTKRRLERMKRLIGRYGNHDPIITSDHIRTAISTFGKIISLGNTTTTLVPLKMGISHAPLAQVGGATKDITRYGTYLLEELDGTLSQDTSPCLTALLCGHLHAEGRSIVRPGTRIICGGATAKDAKKSEEHAPSFGELLISQKENHWSIRHFKYSWNREKNNWERGRKPEDVWTVQKRIQI